MQLPPYIPVKETTTSKTHTFFEEFITLYPHTIERNRKLRFLYYLIAIVTSILALKIKLALYTTLGSETPFLLLFSAVFISGWLGGFGPAIVATIITGIGAGYFFLPATAPNETIRWVQLIIYLGEALLLSIFLESARISINNIKIKIQQQATIAHLGHIALATTDVAKLLQKTVILISQTLQVDYCKIVEILPDQKSLIIRAGTGWGKGVVGHTIISSGINSQAGYTLFSKKPVIVKNLNFDKRFSDNDFLLRYNIVSGMGVAISDEKNPFGVISVHTTYERTFTQDDIYFLQAISNIIATAIERNNLEKRKDDFIGFASHELKTPVTSLKVFGQFLEKYVKENSSDNKLSLYVKKINSQTDRLTSLITNLLDITKIQKKKLDIYKTNFNIKNLITETIQNIQLTTKQKINVIGNATSNITADKDRIEQVLLNLLSNAIKYSPSEKDIMVSLTENKTNIMISIHDEGIGIEKKYHPFIFNQFFRIHHKTDKTYPGLGIGLSICYDIVTRHHGKIWLASEKGKGTTFSFSLPKS